MALNPDHPRLDLVTKRLDALKAFRALPEAAALAAANKRIQNILPQAGETSGEPVDGSLLREEAEHELLARVTEVRAKVEPLFAAGDYAGALMRLAALRDPVDLFFDKVMVMVDDEMLRASRLRLLRQIRELFLNVADFSRLQS
jgi:glycyl-tRNA synthetase beta chain